jgi:hypothetical protein
MASNKTWITVAGTAPEFPDGSGSTGFPFNLLTREVGAQKNRESAANITGINENKKM